MLPVLPTHSQGCFPSSSHHCSESGSSSGTWAVLVAHGLSPVPCPAPHPTRLAERRGKSQAVFSINKMLPFKMTRCGNRHQTGRRIPRQRGTSPYASSKCICFGKCHPRGVRAGAGACSCSKGKAFVGSTAELLTRLGSSTWNPGTAGLAALPGNPVSPHSVPTPCPRSLSLFSVPNPRPNSVSLSCAPAACPNPVPQLHVPALHPCPTSLSCVPARVAALQTLVTQAGYCRAEEGSVSQLRVPSWTMPNRAVPCQTFQGSGGRLGAPQVGPDPSRHRWEGSRSQFTCKCPY